MNALKRSVLSVALALGMCASAEEVESLSVERLGIELRKQLKGLEAESKLGELEPDLRKALDSPNERTRLEAYYAVFDTARAKPPGSALRKELVGLLTAGLADKADVVSSGVRARLIRHFCESDFTPGARNGIVEHFRTEPNSKDAVLLSGLFAYDAVNEEVRTLAELPLKKLDSGRLDGTGVWAAHLIAARHGDAAALRRILEAIDSETDVVLKMTVLIYDLRVVPQPAVAEYLKTLAQSDYRLPQVKLTAPGTLVASHSIEVLRMLLANAPQRDPKGGSGEADLARFRVWLSQQTKWEFKKCATY